jgi:hypothetical protein
VLQTLIGVVIGVCWIVGRVSEVHSCHKVSCIRKLPLATLAMLMAISINADGYFYIGDPQLACNCRSVTKCVEICAHVMLVSTNECSVLSLHELFDLRCEFAMLSRSQFIANVMHVTIPAQPLPKCQTNEALDKLGTPYLNGSPGFVPMEHGFDHSDE